MEGYVGIHIDNSMDRQTDKQKEVCMHDCQMRWTDRQRRGWVDDACMHAWTGGRTDAWVDGWDTQLSRNRAKNHFSYPLIQSLHFTDRKVTLREGKWLT